MWPLNHGTRIRSSGAATQVDSLRPTTTDDFPGDLDELLREIELRSQANRRRRSPELEREVLRLRHLAGARLVLEDRSAPQFVAPDFDRLPAADAITEVSRSNLSAGLIRAGILRDGSVLVRNLIDPEEARALAADIERSFRERDLAIDGDFSDPEYYREFEALQPFALTDLARKVVAQCCGLPVVDAPGPGYRLIELLESRGIARLVAEYLGDRPVISAQKTTLRKVDPPPGRAWHQDARAFGTDVHALNLWLPLSPCGVEAPGIDIVPRRMHELLPVGTDDAVFEFQVSDRQAVSAAEGSPVVRLICEPGDALLFDELLLHATSFEPAMHKSRLGLECWFFAGGGFPETYTPIVV